MFADLDLPDEHVFTEDKSLHATALYPLRLFKYGEKVAGIEEKRELLKLVLMNHLTTTVLKFA